MVFSVKITTMHKISELFCPHYCLMCGKLGGILCEECKNYNSSSYVNKCLKCGVIIEDVCKTCRLPYGHSWVVGRRDEKLGKMVDGLKYESIRALTLPIAEMIDGVLPCLPESTIVVPVPTIARHARERGLDHTLLIAKELARMRGWKCVRLVRRVTDTIQVGASAERRRKQAKKAYELAGEINARRNYLVVDDVCTTGASLEAVCETLRKGGAKNVSVAVLAKSGN